MAEKLSAEQHNMQVWAKIHKMQEEIEELKKTALPVEAVKEVSLPHVNAGALAERQAKFAEDEVQKAAMQLVMDKAKAEISKKAK